MEWFMYRINSLFPNSLELIKYCKKVLYATTISQITDSMDNFEEAIKYADYFNYDSLDIKFYNWKELEEIHLYIPEFLKMLELKVSQREEIIFCNIYINKCYIGNLFFCFPLKNHVLMLSPELSRDYFSFFHTLNGTSFIKTILYLIIFSFAYVNEKFSNKTIYNAINEIYIS